MPKILPNLCKGVARRKGIKILFAYAHEMHEILAEDMVCFVIRYYIRLAANEVSGLLSFSA